ncbi:hypothetical protein ASPZODRAFT_14429 [Penicilliopsis zonata CBS 506.65]|uniref:Uncharacterized protein n=1 Tax=Penicilliopsis zonata CBS 506.65 TaxID=1073090 RepID=A0A1L9SM08_9EURO|nr:hypothetical protein ASPZODRAFT_14429 [Penicilliopsis zonata CBS 506.65]OJJ48279.1 hypothetical protein ASPZODRAFT_14429 [Penicilliopsis zonata CBS 506.65]
MSVKFPVTNLDLPAAWDAKPSVTHSEIRTEQEQPLQEQGHRLFQALIASLDILLPPQRRQAISAFIITHPLLVSAVAVQVLFACIPLAFFAAGIFIAASAAGILSAFFGLVLLLPCLCVTACLALMVWGGIWMGYISLKWIQKYSNTKISN